jgi:hypothetical protein
MREQNPMGIDALTPQEKAFLEAEILDAHTAGQMSWRYEALNVLLWALSIGPNHLSSAGETVDVNALSECVLEIARDSNRKLDLRPAAGDSRCAGPHLEATLDHPTGPPERY